MEALLNKYHYAVYAISVFLAAFLLFLVQPFIGKYILPWFGGGPAVWSVVLVFFQTMLLFGYLYAHLLSKTKIKTQIIVHLSLFAICLILLPIIPDPALKPTGAENPIFYILFLLFTTVGLPYFLLAGSSPLLQSWFAKSQDKHSPYPLYAISNIASVLALISYPFIFEPILILDQQAIFWSIVFITLIGAILFAALALVKRKQNHVETETGEKPKLAKRLLWIALPAVGTMALLAFTNQQSLDIAPIPFLWILPLIIYLITFILVFADQKYFFPRDVLFLMLVVSTGFFIYVQFSNLIYPIVQSIIFYNVVLFIICMIAHGEVVRIKPDPKYLTTFYLHLSFGGALGGIFVGIIAPYIFPTYIELGLTFISLFLLLLIIKIAESKQNKHSKPILYQVYLLFFLFLATSNFFIFYYSQSISEPMHISRNFFGVHRITENELDNGDAYIGILNGSTLHGLQFLNPDKALAPTSYYTKNSGVGLSFEALDRQEPLRVGVAGLGAGMLLTYGEMGDYFRYYEIDPKVIELANQYFSYLEVATTNFDIVTADARLALEKEKNQNFDILVLDAFSSDSIPIHLLTKEAMEIYQKHIKPDGIITFHVSNRHLDLEPVVRGLAESYGLKSVQIITKENDETDFATSWILVTKNEQFLSNQVVQGRTAKPSKKPALLWTDSYSSLLPIIK